MKKLDLELFNDVKAARINLINSRERVTVAAVKRELNIKGKDSIISAYLKRIKAQENADISNTVLSTICHR